MAEEEQETEGTTEALEADGQAAQTQEAATGEEPTAGQADAPEFLTLAQVQELLGQAFVEYDRQSRRVTQSQLDKRDGRFQKWLTQQAAQIESLTDFAKTTLGLDDAAVQKLQGGLTKRVLDAVGDAGRRSQKQRQAFDFEDEDADEDPYGGRGQQYDHDAVMDSAWQIWEKYGLERGDPEEALIATSGVSPEDYLRSIEYAGRLKAKRIGTQKPAQQQAVGGPGQAGAGDGKASARASAASPGGKQAGGVNPIAKINDPSELYKLAEAELAKLKG